MNPPRSFSAGLLRPAILAVIGLGLCAQPATPALADESPAQAAPAQATAPAPQAAGPAGGTQEGAAPAGEAPESARSVLAKWMETERIIAQERDAWQHSRDMLKARIDLVNGEIQAQQEKMTQLKTTGADLGGKRAALAADDQTARGALDTLSESIGSLEEAVRGLSVRFPEPLLARVRPLLDRMPADPAHTKVSLAERFQNVVGILNEANKFDNDISMNAEIRTLANGTPSEVRVVYVGLGQAYFVSANGEAGIGHPGPDGWRWEVDRTIAPAVAQVVEILQAKSKPKLVPLPVDIR
jgi:hypothetical protein